MSACRTAALCLAVLLTVGPSGAWAAKEWTQWGGSDGRNMVSDETGLADSFVPGKKRPNGDGIDPASTENVKWSARLGSCAYGNPTVADGRVFVGTDDVTLAEDDRFDRTKGGLVKCLDEKTGELLWQLVIPQRTGGLPKGALFTHQFLGVCSSPTVDGDRVYVVTSADELVCLDVHGQADGNDGPFQDEAQYMVGPDKPPVKLTDHDADIIWRFDIIGQLGVVPHDAASCAALVHGSMVYVGTSNGVDKPHERVLNPQAPSLIVLDKRTGRLVATDGEKIGTRLYHAQWSPPSLGEVNGKTLIFFGGGDGICYAFEAFDDAAIPDSPLPLAGEGPGVRAGGSNGRPAAKPATPEGGSPIFVSRKSGQSPRAGSPLTLKKVWSYDCNPPEFKYRDGKPIPYYNGDKRKKRGNTGDGTYVGPCQIIATPVFHDGRVYVALGQDPAHGRGRGMLHAIDASGSGDITTSGKVWTYDGIERSISSVAIADGLLYVGDVGGTLHCLDVATGKRRWIYSSHEESWGTPLVADGKIYWGTQRHFYVFAAGAQEKRLSKIYLGSPVYTTPVAADGVLYVASQRYLWAVEKSRPEEGR